MPSDDALQVITKQILAQSDDALIPLCVCQFDIITWHVRASTIVVLKNYFLHLHIQKEGYNIGVIGKFFTYIAIVHSYVWQCNVAKS